MTPEEMQAFLRQSMEAVQGMLAGLDPVDRAVLEQQLGAAGQQMAAGFLGHGAERHLDYRGDIKAAVGLGGALVFVTAHPEGQPTALFRLDVLHLTLTSQPLPCGGVALAADGVTVFVGGTDRRVYAGTKAPKPHGEPLPGPIAALVPVAGDRLAVLAGPQLLLLSRNDGQVLQTLDLP
jgi:ParB family chromosome partitioning protein